MCIVLYCTKLYHTSQHKWPKGCQKSGMVQFTTVVCSIVEMEINAVLYTVLHPTVQLSVNGPKMYNFSFLVQTNRIKLQM